jgi:hypothetical protein
MRSEAAIDPSLQRIEVRMLMSFQFSWWKLTVDLAYRTDRASDASSEFAQITAEFVDVAPGATRRRNSWNSRVTPALHSVSFERDALRVWPFSVG